MKICPECKKKTLLIEAPLKRGNYYFIPKISKPLPSVTSILEILAKPALIRWAAETAARSALENPWQSLNEAVSAIYQTKEKAGSKGKDIHKIIQNIIKGGKVIKNKLIEGYITAYEKFKEAMPHKVLGSEKIVWSRKYGYAGTLDAIIKLQSGELALCDYKTGKFVYPESGIQLIAYKQALAEMYPNKRPMTKMLIIHLKSDATFSVQEMNTPFSVFLNAFALWKWKEGLTK